MKVWILNERLALSFQVHQISCTRGTGFRPPYQDEQMGLLMDVLVCGQSLIQCALDTHEP